MRYQLSVAANVYTSSNGGESANGKNYITFRYGEHFILRNAFQSTGRTADLIEDVCFPRESAMFSCVTSVSSAAPNARGYSRGASTRCGELNALVWLASATYDVTLHFYGEIEVSVVQDEPRFFLTQSEFKFFTFA
jgi:hypothetical protein